MPIVYCCTADYVIYNRIKVISECKSTVTFEMYVIKMIYNHAIQCDNRLTLYNANMSQNFFRSHPLFTIDNKANFLLENNTSVAQDLQTMARTIEKEVPIGTDMPKGSKWEEDVK